MTKTTKKGEIATVKKLPKGWRVLKGTTTQPNGTVWIANNKSMFDKKYQQQLLIVDKGLFKESEKRKKQRAAARLKATKSAAPKISVSPKIVKQKMVPVTVKKHRDKMGNHNHVILDNIGNKHVSVGLTTRVKKGKNSTNYRLQKDTLDIGQKGYKPKNPTYMRRQGTVAKKSEYYQERKGSMVKKDYQKAVEYGNTAKEKFLQKKSNGSAKRVNQSPSARGSKTTRPLLNKKISKPKPNVKIKKVTVKKHK